MDFCQQSDVYNIQTLTIGKHLKDCLTYLFLIQVILKEINPDYSLEGLMLKLQYFGHVVERANSLEKTLMLGKTEGERRRGHRG